VLVPSKPTKRKARRTVKPQVVDAVTQFPFEENRIYQIAVSPGYFTAIHLEPGERLGKFMIGEPDPADWLVEHTTAMTAKGQQFVVLIKPGRAGIDTNLFLPTSKRTYQLDVKSYAKRAMDWVRWTYPEQEQAANSLLANSAPTCSGDVFDPTSLDRSYSITVAQGESPRWMPVSAFSLGGKSYVEFPARLGQIPAPSLFMASSNGLSPAQFRARGRFYEIDRQVQAAELHQGGTVVRITRNGA
jgi:type IV secretion system protein VirB9